MNHEELLKYNKVQLELMEIHRWTESEKAGHDLGDLAYLDWVKRHSAKFRKEWLEKSGPEKE